jgi:DNA-binding beta-propeller fold protein YncE
MKHDILIWTTVGVVVVLPLGGCAVGSIVPTAAAPFVYVANKGRDNISQFDASPSRGGALTPLTPATVPSGPLPNAIAVSPQGTNAYVVDVGSFGAPANEISQYSISPITGRLTAKSPATVATGAGPDAIAVTPDGMSVYVADTGTHLVSQYSVNPLTGDLIPKSPATVDAGRGPTAVAVSPNGKSVYVANIEANTISQYSVNPITGDLIPKSPATVATGAGAQFIRITPDGLSAHVVNSGPGKSGTTKPSAGGRAPSGGKGGKAGMVSQYSINPTTGNLTAKSPAAVAIAGGPHDLAIAPDGKNAYVVSVLHNTVSQYRISSRTGTLSSKPASTAVTGLRPENIVMAPDGDNAYVDSEDNGAVSQYTINPRTDKIARMSPATVSTASGSIGMAIT